MRKSFIFIICIAVVYLLIGFDENEASSNITLENQDISNWKTLKHDTPETLFQISYPSNANLTENFSFTEPEEVTLQNNLMTKNLALVEPEKLAVVTSAENPDIRTLFVTGSVVNVRSGPSTNFQVVGKLSKGEKTISFGAPRGGWTRIRYSESGKLGWMATRFLTSSEPTRIVSAPERPVKKRTVAVPAASEINAARKAIIRSSIAAYQGSCPCPYNRDRGGRRCGKRSAWSRPGGHSPICYDSDISQARLDTYFARKRGATN